MQSPRELVDAMLEASRLLNEAQAELERRSTEQALAESEFRRARAKAYLSVKGTVAEREAQTDQLVEDERIQRDMAEALARSALEAVRNRRTQLTVLQTIGNAMREEMKFARTGPDL